MRTDFFRGTAAVVGAFVLGTYAYAAYLDSAYTIGNNREFYFVVSETSHVEASAQFITLSGGAGYALTHKGEPYAAYAVYLSQNGANYAESALTGAKTVTLFGKPLCFKSRADKKKAGKVLGGMESLYGCIKVLEAEIARLENGATQESSKRILRTLERNFSFLRREYEKRFPAYAQECARTAARLKEMQEEVVSVSKLRYLECSLCEAYVRLSGMFHL